MCAERERETGQSVGNANKAWRRRRRHTRTEKLWNAAYSAAYSSEISAVRARPDRPIVPDALLLLRRIALGTVRVVRVRCWFAIGDAPSGWRLVRGCPTLRNRSREEPPERPLRLPVDAVVATRGTRLGPPPNRTRVDIVGAYSTI